MCLVYSKYHTTKLRRELKTKGKITVYKILEKNGKYLGSIFYHNTWQIGENVSNRAAKTLHETEVELGYIDYGFHVYLTRQAAKEYAKSTEVIVKFTAKAEDLIAAAKPVIEQIGWQLTDKIVVQEAVFSKLTLHKSTWEKIMK